MTLTPEDRKALEVRFTARFGEDSPTYGRIAEHVVRNREVLNVFDHLPTAKQRPVLLFAAVHFLVLQGTSHKLARLYGAPESHEAMEEVGETFIDFVETHERDVRSVMADRSVQTNEVNRCAALLPALMNVEQQSKRPISLIDLGASAGLNLLLDRFRYDYEGGPVIGPPGASVRLHTKLTGRVPQMSFAAPLIETRIGVDADPIDIQDPDEEMWLRACVWVGQVARDQRLTAALDLARREWPEVRRGDAAALLPSAAEDCAEHTQICVITSWLMGWLDEAKRNEIALGIAAIGKSRPISWISFEWPGVVPGLPSIEVEPSESLLGLQEFEPGHLGPVRRKILGTAHHHGAWLNWTDEESAAW